MIDRIYSELAKKVPTKDHDGNPNGFLVELQKDGDLTTLYLTAATPGAFKGFHLHRVRAARYCVVKGKMRITMFTHRDGKWEKEEKILDATDPERLFIPKDVATGLENIGSEDAWLVNYPDPAYDPTLNDEQVEYTLLELEDGVVK
jgi:dTDP-4-dehydrorhamnose 3,5-epimerase-like enzyme